MKFYSILFLLLSNTSFAQRHWQNVDSLFAPLPQNFHVYRSTDSLDGKPFVAYYAEAKLKDKKLDFTTDTTYKRRLTPQQFFQKNNQPLLVVNCTFFSYETNKNLNLVVKDGKILGYNIHTIAGRGKDTLTYRHPFGSAIGIDKKRNADVAWILTDSLKRKPFALEESPTKIIKDSLQNPTFKYLKHGKISFVDGSFSGVKYKKGQFKKWKPKTAVGGGPVLLQNGEIKITNEEELKFTGKAINDKHPRTCMGYTTDGRLIIMVIQGRFVNIADGTTLTQEAQLLKDLGCVEALNLDGGGSSCMIINGKETITPSDKTGQRPVPAVFLIQQKK
jgi:exopolysaccharide biosynthesis protein